MTHASVCGDVYVHRGGFYIRATLYNSKVENTHLSESDDPLLGAHDAASDHDVVLIDLSVVGESSHRGDRLPRKIVIGRDVVLDHLAIFSVDTLKTNTGRTV